MQSFLQITVSWVLCLGILIVGTSLADAQRIPLADPSVFPHLSVLSVETGNAIQNLKRPVSPEPPEEGSPRSRAQLVQSRELVEQKRQSHDLFGSDLREEVQESACAKKIREMFPPAVLPISALNLDQATVDHRESTVVIPLKEPHEGIRGIWFDTETITTALEIIRLLRTRKIGAVSVSPLGRRPSVFYMFNGVSKEDRQACRRERVLELLGTCTECEVLEWHSLQP